MKRVLIAVLAVAVGLISLPAPAGQKEHTGAEKLGWKLAMQSWTIQNSVYESIDICKKLGLKYIEIYPNQPLTAVDKTKDDKEKAKFGPGMTEDQIKAVLEKAKSCGVQIIDCGVIGIPKEEKEARKVFEWAKKVGITILVAEPDPKTLPMIDKVAGDFNIKVALHDHPKPSTYWDPEFVDAVTRDLKNVGFCADVGHWKRSGLDPVAVLKKHGDRVVSVHFKDLAKGGGPHNYHDVLWGKGECDAAGMLAVLKEKNFRGPIAIEWESKWDVPTLQQCVDFFHVEANKLAKK